MAKIGECGAGQQARRKTSELALVGSSWNDRGWAVLTTFGKMGAFYSHAVTIVQVQVLYERKIKEANYSEKVPIGFIGRSSLRLCFCAKRAGR